MKQTLLIFFLICCSKQVICQDGMLLVKRADSLLKSGNKVKALAAYDEVIELVLTEKIEDIDSWDYLLKRAAQVAYEIRRADLAKKYWNLVYGTKAEKLDDKIQFLQNMGIRNMFTYEETFHGTYTALNAAECTSNYRKVLIWFDKEKMFLQLFTECDTYRPISYDHSKLAGFYQENFMKMRTEEIKPFQKAPAHITNYNLELIDGDLNIKKTFNIKYDLAPPSLTYSPLELQTRYKHVIDTYNTNNNAALGKLLIETVPTVNKYLDFIETGKEKARRGKF